MLARSGSSHKKGRPNRPYEGTGAALGKRLIKAASSFMISLKLPFCQQNQEDSGYEQLEKAQA